MAWMFLTANCAACGKVFTCNPDLVPVAVVDGERLPICKECVEKANPIREEKGLPPIQVYPDSYEPQECV